MTRLKSILLLLFVGLSPLLPAQNNSSRTRLSNVTYKGNDFSSETIYQYDSELKIKKIIYKQDGKQHYVITDFIFNPQGMVSSYIKTYSLKISPQKTEIKYDDNKRIQKITVTRTQPGDKPATVNVFDFSWSDDKLSISNMGSNTRYFYDSTKKINRVEFSTNGADPFQYNQYDNSLNPLSLTGGYADEKPLSKNNPAWQQLGSERYVSKIKTTYQKVMVQKHTAGGPKIPTQYKNGLPLQSVTSWYDPDAKRTMITGTTTYKYINLAP